MKTGLLLTRPLAFLSASRQYISPASSFLSRTTTRQPHQLAFGLLAGAAALTTTTATSLSATKNTNTATDCAAAMDTGYLNATAAAALDGELMTEPGFSLEQLMELAGLSVAEAVYQLVQEELSSSSSSSSRHTSGSTANSKPHILLVCGPGNNGGDGLVAARHLFHFGYDCTLVYPKRSKKQHFINLQQQCTDLGIAIRNDMPADFDQPGRYAALVDAIFGFSFHGEPREPFATILLQQFPQFPGPVIAVDVPSGWHVDEGDVAGTGFMPAALISLTAPKNCARNFSGRHFVGGRFLPPTLAEKYNVRMPAYPGTRQVVEVGGSSSNGASGWEEGYFAYLAEKEAKLCQAAADEKKKTKAEDESWQAEYAAHLAEKESKEFAAYTKKEQEKSE